MKIAGLFLILAFLAHAEMPLTAKLCDMVERPDQFKDKLVSVRAETFVAFETQALIDGSCPNERIWFELDDLLKRDGEYSTINRAWNNNGVNPRKKVTATLIGYYETGGSRAATKEAGQKAGSSQ